MSVRIRQYLLYGLSVFFLLAATPWWYARTNEEYILYRRGDDFFAEGDIRSAAEYYELARQKGISDPMLLNRLGDSYLTLQDFESALEVFQKMRALMPDDLGVLIKTAYVYSLNNDTSRAVHIMNQVLKQRPGWKTGLLWKARIEAQAGRFDEAIEIYSRVLGE